MPVCVETKLTLSAKVDRFECHLLLVNGSFGILKYVIEKHYEVHGIQLRPGDVTYGLYWQDRPYTLYVWPQAHGRRIYYFNIADRVSLSVKEFIWRDLAVDVLIDDDAAVHVLDENELPGSLSVPLLEFIESAKNDIVRNHQKIIQEADAALDSVT